LPVSKGGFSSEESHEKIAKATNAIKNLKKCFTDNVFFYYLASLNPVSSLNVNLAKLFFLNHKTMPLRTFVKVGSVTNLSDARYCAGMGVDLLGFRVVEGQENYIKPSQFQEIRGWITGPLVVAEIYGLKNPDELKAIIENFKPDYLEMGMHELLEFSTLPLPFLLSTENSISSNLPVQPHYLISKKPFDTVIPLLIEVQATGDVMPLLGNNNVKGIVLKGGIELKPGLKDYEAMNEILELLEVD
jgi:phosphoribosylanthranilate isomerase